MPKDDHCHSFCLIFLGEVVAKFVLHLFIISVVVVGVILVTLLLLCEHIMSSLKV